MNAGNRNAFWAMFWKECRENVKWSLMAAAGLLLAIAVAGGQSNSAYHYQAKPLYDFWNSVDNTVAMGAVLTALLIGMLQILPERRRDQWAFLMHRPAPRATLFWGKACAGLTLYALAVMAPLSIVSAWAAAPGHIAGPFDPHLMLGGFAAIACGVNIYFAALIVALRPARWYGSRLLPLVAGGALAFAMYSMPQEFWQTMALLPLCVLPLALAAVNAFAAPDSKAQRSPAGKAGLTVTLLGGALIACLAGLALMAGVLTGIAPPRAAQRFDQYATLPSGQIVVVSDILHFPHTVREVHDLAGHALSIPEKDINQPSAVSYGVDRHYDLTNTFASPYRYLYPITFTPRSMENTVWFYVAASRRVAVYSTQDCRLIGEIGSSGAAPAGAERPAPFPADYSTISMIDSMNDALWVFGRQIYRLHTEDAGNAPFSLARIHVTPLLSPSLTENVISLTPNTAVDQQYFVSTIHNIQIVNARGARLLSVPVPPGQAVEITSISGSQGTKLGGQNEKHYQIWTYANDASPKIVTEYSSDGRVLGRQTLPALPQTQYSNPWMGLFGTVFATTFVLFIAAMHITGPDDMGYLIVSSLFAVTWALFCGLAIRRAGFAIRAQIAGAVAGLSLGLPALVTILSLYRWPERIPCPNCARKRMVTRELCEYCGEAFPEPKRDGTEIYEAPGLLLIGEEAA